MVIAPTAGTSLKGPAGMKIVRRIAVLSSEFIARGRTILRLIYTLGRCYALGSGSSQSSIFGFTPT